MASGMPGVSLSQTARVASGVTSRGAKPVPPVVTISCTVPLSASRHSTASISACSSGTMTASTTAYPASFQHGRHQGPPPSGRSPRKLRSLTVTTAALNIARPPFHFSRRMSSGGMAAVSRACPAPPARRPCPVPSAAGGASDAAPSGRSSTTVENTSSITRTTAQGKLFSVPGGAGRPGGPGRRWSAHGPPPDRHTGG